MFKYIFSIIITLILYSCNQQIIYSGKILNKDSLENINFKNKTILLEKLGKPNFIDSIENKYFYFSEKKIKKNFLRNKTEYSYIFVFKFNDADNITKTKVYNLLDKGDLEIVSEETENNIIKRGLIEKIFGGVGSQELPTSQ